MCIAADYGYVYEIGPVIWAENSNTSRHVTGYTGQDIELAIEQHYREAGMIDVLLRHILKDINKRFHDEL